MIIQIMASHLMLSLKKAAAESVGPWHLATTATPRFAPHMHSVSRNTSETPSALDEEAIELGTVSQDRVM